MTPHQLAFYQAQKQLYQQPSPWSRQIKSSLATLEAGLAPYLAWPAVHMISAAVLERSLQTDCPSHFIDQGTYYLVASAACGAAAKELVQYVPRLPWPSP